MGSILALDLSTHTGWAALYEGRIESGVQHFETRRGESPGMRFVRLNAWLSEIFSLTQPKLVVYEQAHYRGGAATELCVGFTTRVVEAAAQRHIDYEAVKSSTLKKFATSKGNASKEEMIAATKDHYAYMRDRTDLDDNEADALCLLWYARHFYEAHL